MTLTNMIAIGTAAALLLACALPVQAQQNGIATFGKGAKLVLHSKAKVGRRQKTAYNDFLKNKTYFGAIALHAGGEHVVWFRDMHNLETAREFAVGGCKEIARQAGDAPEACFLYASTIPKTIAPTTRSASGLSERALAVFKGKYRSRQKPGRWGAFAISGIYDWAFTADRPSQSEATGSAIAICEAAAAKTIAGWSNAIRGEISRRGFNRCRVVHVARH